MNLPPTYYDVMLGRELDRPMVEAARADIAQMKGVGPFSATDDFSTHFDAYMEHVHERVGLDTQQRLQAMGVYSPSEIEAAVNQFFDSPDFKRLLYCKHVDYLTLVNFELFGRKTFYLNPNLIDQLAITDLEVESEFLRLPFDSCLFVLTGKTALRAFYSVGKRPDEEIDFQTPVSVFASSVPANEGGRKIMFACWHANRRANHSFIKRELLIRDGWKLSETLRTDWNDIYRELGKEDEPTINEVIYGKPVDDTALVLDGVLFFRIVLNAILYLGSNDPSVVQHFSPHPKLLARLEAVKSSAKRRKAKVKLNTHPNLTLLKWAQTQSQLLCKNPTRRLRMALNKASYSLPSASSCEVTGEINRMVRNLASVS